MPLYVQAGLWGLLSGSALVLGAALAWFARLPERLVAAVMAFGAGVLISALSFDLMDEAHRQGGFLPVATGFLAGAAAFTFANIGLAWWGARHRKRSGQHQAEEGGSGLAIAVGALLDGIPESVVIGVSLLSGKGVSLVAVAAIFLSNLPEGLSSAAGMRKAGRSAAYVFGVWGGIAALSGLAALIGNVALAGVSPGVVALVTAVAAGAILAMLADTMIPEAFEAAHDYAGLVTAAGFLAAFALTKLGD
jgi:ZIP family zinc transporter